MSHLEVASLEGGSRGHDYLRLLALARVSLLPVAPSRLLWVHTRLAADLEVLAGFDCSDSPVEALWPSSHGLVVLIARTKHLSCAVGSARKGWAVEWHVVVWLQESRAEIFLALKA